MKYAVEKTSILVLIALMALSMGAWAQGADPVGIVIGDGVTNAGDTVEIPVSIQAGNTSPSVMIIFISYDPLLVQPVSDFYELIQRDFTGQPILDQQGNAIAINSAVRPAQAVLDAGKVFEVEIFDEGVIGVGILGLNEVLIPNGPLMTVAFEVFAGVAPQQVMTLTGVTDVAPIQIGTDLVSSSASDSLGAILIDFSNGQIALGCIASDAPVNVTASADRSDGVFVSWNSVAGAGIEYRVYRGTNSNLVSASPIGAAWQTATTLLDITAQVPIVTNSNNCAGPAVVTPVKYYYWVKSRTDLGCESAFSAPAAEGSRGGSKFGASIAGISPLQSAAAGWSDLVVMLLAGLTFAVLSKRRAVGKRRG